MNKAHAKDVSNVYTLTNFAVGSTKAGVTQTVVFSDPVYTHPADKTRVVCALVDV